MKQFKGTKGKWSVKNIFRKPEVITDISNQTVCLIKEVLTVKIHDDDSESNIGQSHNEMMATAKLIAAAPELLEALQELSKLIDDGDLVRDISKDHDKSYFISQGIRIVKAIGKYQKAINKAL